MSHSATSRHGNSCNSPAIACHLRTSANSSATAMGPASSRWTTHCPARFRGRLPTARARRRCIWAERWRKLSASEDAIRHGHHAERPFVLLSQPTLFDPSRAPEGKHIAWAYCHLPNGSEFDMLPRLEAQIERFAPGFCDCVLERRVFSPAALQAMDANLIGGDIGGGLTSLSQFLFRPTMRQYATSARDIYLCSSSTPPGAGVHGMCGYNAAIRALKHL